MRKIDFNENFSGFEDGEDILVDTGIIFALANIYDAWHNTVTNLFDKQYLITPMLFFFMLTLQS